jgi:hypothetical protein
MKQSASKTIERLASVKNPVPPPPIPLNPEETAHYLGVMSSVPTMNHHSETVRALAAAIAQAEHEMTLASEIIARDGLVVTSSQGPKANPAIQIRDAATKRLAACASRLKTLPLQDDARTGQRVAAAESSLRGGPAMLAAAPAAGPSPDWAAMAKVHR